MDDGGALDAEGTRRGSAGLSLGETFRAGARAAFQSPVKTGLLALGAVVAGFSLALAVGAILLPWLLSALSAHQLRQGRVRAPIGWRVRGWILLFEALGVALFSALCMLCMLSWNVPGPELEAPLHTRLAVDGLWRAPALLLAAALAVPVRELWMWVPTALLDGAGTPGAALRTSAWLTARGPRSRACLLAGGAPLLPALTLALFGSLALLGDSGDARPYRLPGLLIAASLAVALARGWVSSSYLALRPTLPPPPVQTRRGEIPRWVLSGVLLVLGPLLVVLSVLIPRPPAEGSMPAAARPLLRLTPGERPRAPVPGTTLTVRVSVRRVALVAADGGGSGRIPLPAGHPIEEVRVGRQGETYWLQIHARGAPVRRVPFDAQGVRLDESLTARLARSCGWPLRVLLALAVIGYGLSLSRDVRCAAGLQPRPAGWLARAAPLLPAVMAVVACAVGLASLWRGAW